MLRETQFLLIEKLSVTHSKVHVIPFRDSHDIIFSNTCHNISFPFNTWNVIAPVEFRKYVPEFNKDGPSGSHIKLGICRVGWPGGPGHLKHTHIFTASKLALLTTKQANESEKRRVKTKKGTVFGELTDKKQVRRAPQNNHLVRVWMPGCFVAVQ